MTAPPFPDAIGAGDRPLVRYVRRTIYPYSLYYRRVLDGVGGGRAIKSRADLKRVPPTDLASVREPSQLVLRPDVGSIVRRGDRRLAARVVAAKAVGGMDGFNRRVVDHRFKPVHWILGDGVPLGYSSADLVRLGTLGQAWLAASGVGRGDVLVSLVQPGPRVDYWEVVLGSRRAGVPALHLDPAVDPSVIERVAPTVLAGEARELLGVLNRAASGGHLLPNLRTVLAVGQPLSAELRSQLRDRSGGAAVVAAWAPSGVRALWTECREGAVRHEPTGYHALGDDVLELAAEHDGGTTGELLWTGLGWRGSALLRLRTATTAGLEAGRCPACGRNGPRVVPLAPIRRAELDTTFAMKSLLPLVDAPVPVATGAAIGFSPAGTPTPSPASPPPAAVAAPSPATNGAAPDFVAVLDADPDVKEWQVERRCRAGAEETIVVLAPVWGAAVVPLVRRLDRHVRATQFIVLRHDEVSARLAAAGGQRILDHRQATQERP